MSLSGLRILLAEDNATNQMVAMQMLESLGAEVVLTGDGAEALEAFGRERFDLALIDIEMPRVSGTEVIRRIRAARPPLADMPLIALTAYVMREHRSAIEEAGADGVIAKPILSIEQLGSEILALAGKRWGAARPGAAEPKPAPEAETGPPSRVDLQTYDMLAKSIGEEAMADLLEKIEADLMAAEAETRRGLAEGDIAALRRSSHVLISVAGAIGADALQKHAQRLNSAAHSGEKHAIERWAGDLLSEIGEVLAFVRQRRKR